MVRSAEAEGGGGAGGGGWRQGRLLIVSLSLLITPLSNQCGRRRSAEWHFSALIASRRLLIFAPPAPPPSFFAPMGLPALHTHLNQQLIVSPRRWRRDETLTPKVVSSVVFTLSFVSAAEAVITLHFKGVINNE